MHRLRKYLGAYLLQLADCADVCIVFSAGIGENSAMIRTLTCQHLQVRSLGRRTEHAARPEATSRRMLP